jgi:hypothetical protein
MTSAQIRALMSLPIIPGLSFASATQSAVASRRLDHPGPGHILLITDDLISPGEFLLHSAIAGYLKGNSNGKVLLVSSRDEVHWKTIESKLVRMLIVNAYSQLISL